MADFRNRAYSDFSDVLTDWLRGEEGGSVSDLTLSLINRAQDRLWMHRAWDYLIKYEALTVSSNVAQLPGDFGGIVCRVYEDSNGDGKPDKYYYRDGTVYNGYKITDTFSRTTGHTYEMTFFSSPPNTPYLVYPAILEDFTGSGTEYTFFPAELLIATAQMIHIKEADLRGPEYEAILENQATLLRDYEQSHQYQNTEMNSRVLDDSGEEIINFGYSIDGGPEFGYVGNYDNSMDLSS